MEYHTSALTDTTACNSHKQENLSGNPQPVTVSLLPKRESLQISSESALTVPDHAAHLHHQSDKDDLEFVDASEDVWSLHNSQTKSSVEDTSKKFLQNNKTNQEQAKDQTEFSLNCFSSSCSTGFHNISQETNQMYMQEENVELKEDESVEEHKSVIMHLLSQVKLGMDLTKVVLPTFILEKRSLLEMYADFFSHSDLFVQISVKATPAERMVACLRFYMSTFSAGRDSTVAKKPYNPILGEIFQCFYDDSSLSQMPHTETTLVSDGPVPWAKSNQLTLLAEQVSHHPPISAFYAEHKGRNMQFNGHIWTKSKFLGLSIGVHNIGQGCIHLLDHGEEYIVTFPNGYGRSILTIPWMELGGDCTITCQQTGYKAAIKFHTKPFYGGKIHKVTGEVFEPRVKKPFCMIEGEWHKQMRLIYSSGASECLIDVKNMKRKNKYVRKIELQSPCESRRLWEKVTLSLKANDIENATKAKKVLEELQRQEAKQRSETNLVYKPKHFYLDDCQNWMYKTPLSNRS